MSYRESRQHRPGRRTVEAYCTASDKEWRWENSQGVAARHTDATGHETIVEVTQDIRYYVPGKEWNG